LAFQGRKLKMKVVDKNGMLWKIREKIPRGNEEGKF
jgi:hypothetical protein